MFDRRRLAGHLAAAGAYTIFGFNVIVCKDIAISGTVSPAVLFTLRAIGASALFWLISLFLPKEKVERGDMLKIVLASFLGLFVPQMTFLMSIGITTPIDSSILGSMTPIYTMFFAAFFIKEPITLRKAGGVAMSFIGVLLLIFNSVHAHNGVEQTKPLGVLLMIFNGISFGSYLGAFKPLISKYSVVTFMKWMFLFSLIMVLPFSFSGLFSTDYSAISLKVGLEIGFLILFATCVAYFLIPYGQQRLRPTLVSMYSYLQPTIAAAVSICIGMDILNWQKVLAIILVFAGVAVVNRSRAAGQQQS